MIGDAVYNILYADATIQAAVSTRIYPSVAQQGSTAPFIVYNVVSNAPGDHKDGGQDFDKTRVQINVIDDDYDNVESLAGSIRSALDRYSGTTGSVTINRVYYDDETDLYQDDERLYARAIDFTIISTARS